MSDDPFFINLSVRNKLIGEIKVENGKNDHLYDR